MLNVSEMFLSFTRFKALESKILVFKFCSRLVRETRNDFLADFVIGKGTPKLIFNIKFKILNQCINDLI